MAINCLDTKQARALFTKQELKRIKSQNLTPEEMVKFVRGFQNRKVLDVRQGILQSRAVQKVTDYIESAPKENIRNYINALIFQDRTTKIPGVSLENQQHAIMNQFHGKLFKLMQRFKPKKFGFDVDAKGQADLVRAISGRNINDPDITSMAHIWNKVYEELRVRFNAAGGNMKKPTSVVNLPMHNDPLKVGALGFDRWYNLVKNKLDIEAMGLSPEGLEPALRHAYRGIVTEGASSVKPGKSTIGSQTIIGNRHQDDSFLQFKTSDDWIEYNAKFGNENIYASLTDHVTMMAKEIGAMEALGPNPDLTMRYVRDLAIKKSEDKNIANRVMTAYDVLMGNITPQNRKIAHTMAMLRNIETGLKLPSATLSALPDTFFIGLAAQFNGMPMMKVYSRFIDNLFSFGNRDELASRLWLGLEHAIDAAHTASRFSDVTGQTAAARFAEGVMRVSGLNHWTVAGKQAFGIEIMSSLAYDLKPNMLRALKRYGITEKEIKSVPIFEKDGARFLDLNKADELVAKKIAGMVSSETRMAVPEPDVGVRSMLTQGTAQGSFTGELLRAGSQFKSFPATIILMQLARGLNQQGATRLGYLSSMIVGTTLLGAMSLQLKEISRGRKPVAWDNPELWKKGFLQGGSLGIIGDTVFSDVDRFGASLGDQLIGPLGGDFQRYVLKGLLGVGQDVVSGEVDDAIKNAKRLGARALGDANPFNRLWYTRIIVQRNIQDNIDKLADPNWQSKMRNLERARQKEFNNEFWFPPQ